MAWMKKLFLVCLVLQMTFVYPDDSETDAEEKARMDLQCPSGNKAWSVFKNMCYGYYGIRIRGDEVYRFTCPSLGARVANILSKEIMDHVTEKIQTWELPNHWVATDKPGCSSLQGEVQMTYLSKWSCKRKERIICEVPRNVSATDKKQKGCLLPESVPDTKWTVFGKKCFLSTRQLASATEGFRHCQEKYSGSLPTVENPAELRFVAGNAKGGQWVDPSRGRNPKQGDLERCALLKEKVWTQVEPDCSGYKLCVCEIEARTWTSSDFQGITLKGKEYLFVNIRDTFLHAKAICKLLGGNLASESLQTDIIDSIYDGAEDFGSTPFWMGRNSTDLRKDGCTFVRRTTEQKILYGASCDSYRRTLCVRMIPNDEGKFQEDCYLYMDSSLVEKWQRYNHTCYYLLKIPFAWSKAITTCKENFIASVVNPEKYNEWMNLMGTISMEMWILTQDTKGSLKSSCATMKRSYKIYHPIEKTCAKKKYSVCEVTSTGSRDKNVCDLPPNVFPKGWRRIGKRCYFYVEEKNPSSSISDYCSESFGGTVAFVDSTETATSLVSLINDPSWVIVNCANTFSQKTDGFECPQGRNTAAATMLVSGTEVIIRMDKETSVTQPFICSVAYKD